MKLHPIEVTATSGKELGHQIMAMCYDLILEVIAGMREEVQRQSINDLSNGFARLSTLLNQVDLCLTITEANLENVVNHCSRYILEEKNARNGLVPRS